MTSAGDAASQGDGVGEADVGDAVGEADAGDAVGEADVGAAAGERKAVLRDSLGVSVATGAYGISFGAIAIAGGFSAWQTMALSLLMFSGGSQFGLVGVVAGRGSPWAGAAQRVLRIAAVAVAERAVLAATACRPTRDRRIECDVDGPRLDQGRPAGLLR